MDTNEHPVELAQSAMDFFVHGDTGRNNDSEAFCYIAHLQKSHKCCRRFWGVLLGCTDNNSLWEIVSYQVLIFLYVKRKNK